MSWTNKMAPSEYSENTKNECVSAKRPEIAEQISSTHRQTEELSKIIEVLSARLEPVLRSELKDNENCDKAESPRMTNLGAEINKIKSNIGYNISRIENILGRLEI